MMGTRALLGTPDTQPPYGGARSGTADGAGTSGRVDRTAVAGPEEGTFGGNRAQAPQALLGLALPGELFLGAAPLAALLVDTLDELCGGRFLLWSLLLDLGHL